MLWQILGVLAGVSLFVLAWVCGWHDWVNLLYTGDCADKFFAGFLVCVSLFSGGLITAGLCAAGCGLSTLIGNQQETVWRECWSSPMVSMRNIDGPEGKISGGLFLIAGNIGTSSTYFYYVPTDDGGFRQKKWGPDNDTTIYEEDRTDGLVVQYDLAFQKDWLYLIAVPDGRLRMDFHVPKGSVQKQFHLN